MRIVHAIVASALLVILPLGSSLFGSGTFAWTMYAATGEYRIDIRVRDASGTWHSVAPTGLAGASTRGTAGILVGADHFRRGPSVDALRSHLAELARFACTERAGVEADVMLHERRNASSSERVTTAHADCR